MVDVSRRSVLGVAGRIALLTTAGTLGLTPAFASGTASSGVGSKMKLGESVPFHPSLVEAKARALAETAYKPRANVPKPWLEFEL